MQLWFVVDFFKKSGKWYATEAVKWTGDYSSAEGGQLMMDAFKQSLKYHLKVDGKIRMSDMVAVCLKPYHIDSHPLMIEVARIVD